MRFLNDYHSEDANGCVEFDEVDAGASGCFCEVNLSNSESTLACTEGLEERFP